MSKRLFLMFIERQPASTRFVAIPNQMDPPSSLSLEYPPDQSSSEAKSKECVLDNVGSFGRVPMVSTFSASTLGKYQFFSDFRTSLPLIFTDALAVTFCLFAARLISIGVGSEFLASSVLGAGLIAFTITVQHVHGLYPAVGLGQSLEFRRILRTCLFVSLGLGLTLLTAPQIQASSLLLYLCFCLLLCAVLPITRATSRKIFCRFSWWSQQVLVVGDGFQAEKVFHNLSRSKEEGLRPVGIAYDPTNHWDSDTSGAAVYLGPASAVEQILLATKTSRVVIVRDCATNDFNFVHYCNIPHVSLQAPWVNHPIEKANLVERNGAAEIQCFQRCISPSALVAKRSMDLAIILIFAPLLIPLFGILALMTKLSSPGPVFYGSSRIGRGGKIFQAWKFRSMVSNADAVLQKDLLQHPDLRDEWNRDHKLKDDPRITSIGRLLRKTSLDELPQLWNVLIGEMSLVGPRPMLLDEIAKYGDVYEIYKLVRPGITGLWQISGRNKTSYEARLRFVRFYIQNWSCMMDLYILYRTAKTAVLQEGAY